MTNVSEIAILSSLHISQWEARKYDKKISAKVAKDYGTDSKAGRYNKVLIAREALKAIQSEINGLRDYHKTMTVPWNHAEDMLPVSRLEEYDIETEKRISNIEALADEFETNYPSYIEQAEIELNTMFDLADYPPQDLIRSKFSVRIEKKPVPSAGDFRFKLANEKMEQLKENLKKQNDLKLKNAMAELWNRLYEPVKHMAEVLATPDKNFHKTLISNITDVCNVLPDLNMVGDTDLEKLRQEILEKLTKYDSDELRLDVISRKETANAAKGIMDKIERAIEF